MGARVPGSPCHMPPFFLPQGSLLSADMADMAESSPPPCSSAAAPAAEPGVTEQPGSQSPPPSPPGLEEPLDGADPEVPHPDLAPVAFFCLRQTTSPRNWCIKMVCNPYPLCGGPGCSLTEPCLPPRPLVRRPHWWWWWLASSDGGSGGTSGHGGRGDG